MWLMTRRKLALTEPMPVPFRDDKFPPKMSVSLTVSGHSNDCVIDISLISMLGNNWLKTETNRDR